jgi:hypothetical protein
MYVASDLKHPQFEANPSFSWCVCHSLGMVLQGAVKASLVANSFMFVFCLCSNLVSGDHLCWRILPPSPRYWALPWWRLQSHKRSCYIGACVARASGVFGAPQHKWRSGPNILQLHSFHELESWQYWLIDWTFACIAEWLIEFRFDWLIGYLHYWLIYWLIILHWWRCALAFTQCAIRPIWGRHIWLIDWLIVGATRGSPQPSPRPRAPKQINTLFINYVYVVGVVQ